MSNRIGVHYSSFVAAERMRCIPFCEEEVTHWACWEFRGDKHHACQARCENHRRENEPHTSYHPVKG
jgi:hypothetical protein